MKKDSKFVKFLPVIIIIMIILIVIFAIISIAKALLGGKNSSGQKTTYEIAQTELLTVDTTRAVSMLVRGEIVGEEDFKSHRITVSPTERRIDIYKGYEGQIIATKSFPNTPKAYEEFVYALDKANLVKGAPLDEKQDNTMGICASGAVYEFDLLQNNQSIDHLWTSTCKDSRGSLVANVDQLRTLFRNQIPDARKIIYEARKNN